MKQTLMQRLIDMNYQSVRISLHLSADHLQNGIVMSVYEDTMRLTHVGLQVKTNSFYCSNRSMSNIEINQLIYPLNLFKFIKT